MTKNLREYLTTVGQSILFWIIAFALFHLFRYTGIGAEPAFEVVEEHRDMVNGNRLSFIFLIVGIFIGLLFGSADYLFEKFYSKKISMGVGLVTRTLAYFIITVFTFTAVIEIASTIFHDDSVSNEVGWWRTNITFWVTLVYIVIASLVHSFIKIAAAKFGRGVFTKMLLGKYRNPKEEKRIFMFLDLQSSTTIAEELGHLKYSQFIQDCFLDLNEVVPKHEADIYQYVGDEAVLVWDYKKGIAHDNCVKLYFAFQNMLVSRDDYYQSTYGRSPIFKAGLHGGTLMVAEVGSVKKELAYHGDVINTTARIQSLCNEYQQRLILSQNLASSLALGSGYISVELGLLHLKGKTKEVELIGLKKDV